MTTALPDLTRTRNAVAALDAAWLTLAQLEPSASDAECSVVCDEIDRLTDAVGIAFYLDTADRNSLDACRGLPPGLPGSDTFVRRMLADEENAR